MTNYEKANVLLSMGYASKSPLGHTSKNFDDTGCISFDLGFNIWGYILPDDEKVSIVTYKTVFDYGNIDLDKISVISSDDEFGIEGLKNLDHN